MRFARDDVVEALRVYNDGEHRATWCPRCFHVIVSSTRVKRSSEVIIEGSDQCRVTLVSGSVEDCIEAALRNDQRPLIRRDLA